MRKLIRSILVLAVPLLGVHCAGAQDNLNLIQRAMRDEISRSMNELKLDGYEKPFFINYTLDDIVDYQVIGSLGALVRSSEIPSRSKSSVRILVGDYEFNDESLDNNLFSGAQANEISLPLDDDYLGVRRSFWITTDNVYKNAAQQFQKNTEMMKEQNKPLDEIPHRTFARVPVSNVEVAAADAVFDKVQMENYVRSLSAVFPSFTEITNSSVAFHFQQGHKYLVNSEGSINRTPITMVTLQVNAQLRTKDGEMLFDQLVRYYRSPAQMPDLEVMKKEVKEMAEGMMKAKAFAPFKEDYTGPVLFVGDAAAGLFSGNLFSSDEGLAASNNIPNLKGYRLDNTTSMETKIGKSIFAEGMTVKAVPGMKTYGQVDLLGSFEVDDEGVVPADETVLIENGVFKSALNDRTLTRKDQKANGLGSGPGVIVVSFKSGSTMEMLKGKLISQAKKEGLDFGLIVRDFSFGGFGLVDVYKVNVNDGKEELFRSAMLKNVPVRSLKKVMDVASHQRVTHTRLGNRGQLISVIAPEAVLLEEIEVGESGLPFFDQEEYVPNPLKN